MLPFVIDTHYHRFNNLATCDLIGYPTNLCDNGDMVGKLAAKMRLECVEDDIKASSVVFATALARPGVTLPRIRFISDIPHRMEVQNPDESWRQLASMELMGIDMIAELDEHREITKRHDGTQWEVMTIIFFSHAFESFERTTIELKY